MKLAVVFALLTSAQACQELQDLVPTVSFQRMDVANIDFDHVEADFVFAVDNPNPIDVGLSSFSYDLALQDTQLLAGDDADGFTIEAVGESELRLPLSLRWQDAWDAAQATRGEDLVRFGLSGNLGFNTPLGEARLPYDESGDFPGLRTPKFRFQRVRVERLNLLTQEAELAVDLGIDNPHGSTLFFDGFQYSLDLGGGAVATGTLSQLGGVDGATEGTATLPVVVDLLGVGAEVVNAITRRDPLTLGLAATVDVETPWGVLPLTVDETGDVSLQ